MLLLRALACTSEDDVLLDSGDDKDSGPTGEGPALTLIAPPAFDPIGGGPVAFDVTTDVQRVDLVVKSADGTKVFSATNDAEWDGKVNGAWGTPGLYTIEVTATDNGTGASTVVTQELGLVRVGVVSVFADDDGGVTAERIPLYWAQAQSLQDLDVAISEIDALEDGAGNAVPLPAVGTDLTRPTGASPTGWSYDSRPMLTLLPGEVTVLGSTGLTAIEVGVQVEGWSVISGVPVLPGQPILLQKDEPLASGPGVVEGDLTVSWTAAQDGASVVIGTQAVPWRAYALMGPATFDETGEAYSPWVAAIDPALRAISGVGAERGAVLDALVEWIFYESGLEYDTRSGASAYTAWLGDSWEDEEFNFSAFLIRRFGTTVNCTDCAHILLTYANMLGVELNYTIILQSFNLNYILAIGGTDYTHCPFGSGGCGFSYHAVTTNDGAETIWDATLALDGDEDPGSAPSTELLVQSIPGREYLDRLVMSGTATYNYETKGYLK